MLCFYVLMVGGQKTKGAHHASNTEESIAWNDEGFVGSFFNKGDLLLEKFFRDGRNGEMKSKEGALRRNVYFARPCSDELPSADELTLAI